MEEVKNVADDSAEADSSETADSSPDESLGDGLTNANIASI